MAKKRTKKQDEKPFEFPKGYGGAKGAKAQLYVRTILELKPAMSECVEGSEVEKETIRRMKKAGHDVSGTAVWRELKDYHRMLRRQAGVKLPMVPKGKASKAKVAVPAS